MSVFEIGQEHEEELADYLADSDQEHELGSVFEIGEDFIDPDTGEEVAEVGARFRRRRRGGRRRGMFRRGRARIPAFLARRMRRSGGKKLARLPGKPTVGDRCSRRVYGYAERRTPNEREPCSPLGSSHRCRRRGRLDVGAHHLDQDRRI
jgi:hypothetical protein